MKAAAEYGKQVVKNNMANLKLIRAKEEFKRIEKFGYFFRVDQPADNIYKLF